MGSDPSATAGLRPDLLSAFVIVIVSGAAFGLSFLALSQMTGRLGAVAYLAISTGLCVAPALVLRAVRRLVSLFAVACVVGTTIFCLTTVYALHCRYFLSAPPPRLPVLVAVLASGLAWIAAAIGFITLVIVPARTTTRHGVRTHVLLGIPVAARWFALILLPILFIWLSPPFFVLVLAIPIVVLTLELTGNSLLLAVMRRDRQAPSRGVQQTLEDVARRTGGAIPEVIHVGAQWPAICQVRLRLPGTASLIISEAALGRFSDDGLRAVLAHEYAHITLGHLQTRIAVDAVFAAAVVAGLLPVSRLMVVIQQPAAYGAVVALYLFAATSIRHLLAMNLSRRFERAADAFAVQTVGKAALIEALHASAGEDVPGVVSAFSTHDSMAARRRTLDGSSS